MPIVREIGERNRLWYLVLIFLPGIGMAFAINQIFRLSIFGLQPLDTSYLYLIIACYISIVFVFYPAKSSISQQKVPWYDIILFLLTILIGVYFALHGLEIIELGWEYEAPPIATIFSIILWGVVIEAVRRSSGFTLAFICLLFSFYPLYAGHMPGFLQGQSFDFLTIARNHAMSDNSILGVPLTTVGTLLIGFMFFGVVLQNTGGGDFFLNIANALLGHVRGGPAKVAIVASSFFGTLSGSAVSNVITTGCMTIPAMKKTGYEPHYSGAVEACASTGGTIMPPVMGAAAFVMASFISVPYAEICIAALIPSLLYYLGLFFQVDLHAAKINLRGIPKSELPPVAATLKSGWYYIFVIVILCYFLFTLRVEAWAPFYASAFLIVISFLHRKKGFGFKTILGIIIGTGRVLSELVAILAGVGLLVGALSVTGVAFAFSRELVMAVGQNLFVILLAGALTSFVLGFGMTSTACYIFLSIVMAPALVAVGVKPIAAHFFVLYWGIISFITPPVALAAYAAAGIAQSNPMKTGFTAMRLGIITYFIPFLFVYNPLLLAQGSFGEVFFTFLTAAAGVFFICMGIEGWGIVGIGQMKPLMRLPFIIGGPFLLFPGLKTDIIGAGFCVGTLFGLYVLKRVKHKKEEAPI
jgi:TRAP transporter 4TM/12TM fusion protein